MIYVCVMGHRSEVPTSSRKFTELEGREWGWKKSFDLGKGGGHQ